MGVTEKVLRTGEWDQEKWVRLSSHPLLARCPITALRRVASVADEIKVAAGDVPAEQGRPAAWFFLIHSGVAELSRDGTRLGVLGPGEYFGEVALLARGFQQATVRALTPMSLFVVGSQRFLPLVQDFRWLHQDLGAALERQPRLVKLAREERAKHLYRAASASWVPSAPARRAAPLRLETIL